MKVTPFDVPNKNQCLSVAVLSDVHSEYIDLDAFYTFKRFFENVPKKRRRIILLGDILDMEAFVTKSESYVRAKKDKDFDGYFVPEVKKEYEWFEWFLSELRPLVYDYSNIWFVEGNHEQRLRRHAFKKIVPVEYQPWFDLPLKLQLKERGIPFIQYNDWIGIKTSSGDLNLTHGQYCGMNPIKKHFDGAHTSIMFGHTHERAVKQFNTIMGNMFGFNNPCLCWTEPEYMEGRIHNWSVGWSMIQVTHDNFWVNQFTTEEGKLIDCYGRKI